MTHPTSLAAAAPSAPDELAAAQDQLHYSLSLTARIIQRGQRETVQDVFGERLPRVISDSLRKTIHTNQGDQG